jgi:prepilin-type processing-associated H-X9-DG protein
MHTAKGANCLFGDGSVHFLTSGIDPNTFQYLCTIAGGEVSTNY